MLINKHYCFIFTGFYLFLTNETGGKFMKEKILDRRVRKTRMQLRRCLAALLKEKKLDYVVKCSFRNEIAPGAATTTAQFILSSFGLVLWRSCW